MITEVAPISPGLESVRKAPPEVGTFAGRVLIVNGDIPRDIDPVVTPVIQFDLSMPTGTSHRRVRI